MKLCYNRKLKNPIYFIQISIRNGKKVAIKNVYTIGKPQDLIKDGHNDLLEYYIIIVSFKQ